MKIFIDGIKKGLGQGIGLLVILGVFGIVYATIGSTWTNPGDIEASSGTALTSANWNKMLANMNSLNDRVNNSSWVLDTSGNGVLFSTGCDYKLEVLGKGTITLLNIAKSTAVSSDKTRLQYVGAAGNYYRILYNEKSKYYLNGTDRTLDIGKIWKRCN